MTIDGAEYMSAATKAEWNRNATRTAARAARAAAATSEGRERLTAEILGRIPLEEVEAEVDEGLEREVDFAAAGEGAAAASSAAGSSPPPPAPIAAVFRLAQSESMTPDIPRPASTHAAGAKTSMRRTMTPEK